MTKGIKWTITDPNKDYKGDWYIDLCRKGVVIKTITHADKARVSKLAQEECKNNNQAESMWEKENVTLGSIYRSFYVVTVDSYDKIHTIECCADTLDLAKEYMVENAYLVYDNGLEFRIDEVVRLK